MLRKKVFTPILILTAALFLSGCIEFEKKKLVNLPEAENMLFTETGRLLATSGVGVFEIIGSGSTHTAVPGVIQDPAGFNPGTLANGDFSFCGIVGRGNEIFTVGMTKSIFNARKFLFRAILSPGETPSFDIIHELEDFSLPNGMAIDENGDLYIANTCFLQKGKIVKFSVSADLNSPSVSEIYTIGPADGIYNPNGLKYKDGVLFATDGGKVKKLTLDSNLELSYIKTLYSRLTTFDDLFPYCEGVIVADFMNGTLLYIDDSGKQAETNIGALQGVSSVLPGAPYFGSDQLIVTERGILQDPYTSIGNRISVLTFDFDLVEYETTCGY